MYAVSETFKTKIRELDRVFRLTVTIDHSLGTLTLTDADIVQGSFAITEKSQPGEDFTVGGVVGSDLSMSLVNKTEYDAINFTGAVVTPVVELLIGEPAVYESVPLGVFTIDEVGKQSKTISIKAIDNMIKLDKPYNLSQLTYPATLMEIYNNICTECDVVAGTGTFVNELYVVAEKPEGEHTYRDILSAVAALSGSFARTTRAGAIELVWYSATGISLDGSNRFSFVPSDYAVSITGAVATIDETKYLAGTEDYAVDLSNNPLLQTGDYAAVLLALYNRVKNVSFYPYTSNWQGNPAIQAGDIITQISTSQVSYPTIVTSTTYKYRGSSVLEAQGLVDKSYRGQTSKRLDSLAKIIRANQVKVYDELSNLEQAQLNATELLGNMLGGYFITDEENGILYIADNPDINLAAKVWKWSAGGFGYSETGVAGPYNTAITADGSIVAALVAAGIVSADHITTGTLDAARVTIGAATTFEEGYDPSKITAHSVGMGVDANCIGLWHFDNSLNNHKGVPVESDGTFDAVGAFGQGLNLAAGQKLRVPTTNMTPDQGTITLRVENLAASPDGAVIIDLPQSNNTPGLEVGISDDAGHLGELYVSEITPVLSHIETTQADFQTGALTGVTATSTGNLELTSGSLNGNREKVIDVSSVGASNVGSIISWEKTDAAIIDAVFTRASVATKFDGSQVAAGVPRYEAGSFNKGVLIEEGTTNLVPNGGFENGTTGWITVAETTASSAKAKSGSQSIRFYRAATSTTKTVYTDKIAVSPNTTYTLSAEFWMNLSQGVFYVDYQEYNSSDGLTVDGTNMPPSSINGQVWERKSITFTTTANASYVRVRIAIGSTCIGEAFVDDIQLEQKAYPTSFIEGTRSPELLRIPALNVLHPGAWSVHLRYKALQGASSAVYRMLWNCAIDNDNWYQLGFQASTGYLAVRVNSQGVLTTLVSNITLSSGTTYDITVIGDGSNLKLYINGVQAGATTAYTEPMGTLNTAYIDVGSVLGTDHFANGIIDDLAFFNYTVPFTKPLLWYGGGVPVPMELGCTYKMNLDDTLEAIVGTLQVDVALSTDNGATYGSYVKATSGQSIPGISNDTDLSNARLKLKETLASSRSSVTPQLNSLSLSITQRSPITSYGVNKSTLTGWEYISLAWNVDSLSLVVNDSEVAKIIGPGLPSSLGTYFYVGTDRNSANSILTSIDELRVDKFFIVPELRIAWCKAGSPFYTSEEMKQWPGYMKMDTEGLKLYDSSSVLRVLLGSWLKGAERKYGLKMVGGEIYSSLIRSGEETATTYVELTPSGEFRVVKNGEIVLETLTNVVNGGSLYFYDLSGNMFGRLLRYNDTYPGFAVEGTSSSGGEGPLTLRGNSIQILGNTNVQGNFYCWGSSKYNVEQTENYGNRGLVVRESPEQRYVDEGIGNLVDGLCKVALDPIFLECIEPNAAASRWAIQITPYADVDLYIAEIGSNYFLVKERNGGSNSGAEFAWNLSATRKNYVGIRLMEEV